MFAYKYFMVRKISTTTYLKLVHIAAAFYIWQQQQSAIKISGP